MPKENSDSEKYIIDRYDKAIRYYWHASKRNKQAYKLTRILTLVLGAVVTLLSSLSSADFLTSSPVWDLLFKIGTPTMAALLAITGGFSQTFQWGAAWQDMVMTAQHLEKERDRYIVSSPEKRDNVKEVNLLNDFVLQESQGFFQRLLGGGKTKSPTGTNT